MNIQIIEQQINEIQNGTRDLFQLIKQINAYFPPHYPKSTLYFLQTSSNKDRDRHYGRREGLRRQPKVRRDRSVK